MNKMKKIGLTALAASLVSVSANAVDISGGASLSYNGGNGGATGNPWSMNDSLVFTWGGELDNGMTVDLNFGVIKNGEEKIIAPINAIAEMIIFGFRQ